MSFPFAAYDALMADCQAAPLDGVTVPSPMLKHTISRLLEAERQQNHEEMRVYAIALLRSTVRYIVQHSAEQTPASVLADCRAIVRDRDQAGRNAAVPFWEGFPHGHSDISFELWRRVARIQGAEQRQRPDVALGDAHDLVNYAAFYLLCLDHEKGQTYGDR